MYNPFALIGKTILVTGASSGIGKACAIECSKMGARVVITGRNEERLLSTFEQLEGQGHASICADICQQSDIEQITATTEELDGVVFAAGVSKLKPIMALNEMDLQTVFSTNYFAQALLTKSLLKAKKIRQGASLVYISSISGNGNTATGLSVYGSSKSALTSYVRYAALELSGKQIRCNAILPGRINTDLLQNSTMSDEQIQKDMERYPLKRYGEPEEVAQTAVFLLSDAAKWITGTEIKIDGGRTLV